MLEYSHMLLTKQYRAILIIDDIVFTVWYKTQMQFSVDSSLRLNMTISIIVFITILVFVYSSTSLRLFFN